jgi:hypothetical protein
METNIGTGLAAASPSGKKGPAEAELSRWGLDPSPYGELKGTAARTDSIGTI